VDTPDTPPSPEVEARQPVPVSRQALTTFIVAANVLVFAWMWWKGVSPVHPSVDRMRELGASFGPYVFGDKPWRLVTANYLHFGFGHILTNLLCLWGLGQFAEEFYDWRDYFLLYTFGGVSGTLLSAYMSPLTVGAGASGAIFGIAGALLATLRWGNFQIDPQARKEAYKGVLKFAGLNLILGFALSIALPVGNFAHMGGLIGGLIAGAVLSRHLGPSAQAVRYRTIAWVALIAMFAGAYMAARHSRSFVPAFYAAEQDLQAQRNDAAIAKLNAFTQKYSDIYEGYLLLGEALKRNKDFSAAAQVYGRAADVLPNAPQPLLLKVAAHRAAGEPLQAEATARRLVATAPKEPIAHEMLAQVLIAQKKFAEAERELLTTIRLARIRSPRLWLELGSVQLELGKSKEARENFQQARAAGADEAVALQGMIRASQQLRDGRAVEKYTKWLLELQQNREHEEKLKRRKE
jgi:rhomboid protease GluP